MYSLRNWGLDTVICTKSHGPFFARTFYNLRMPPEKKSAELPEVFELSFLKGVTWS